MANEFKAEVSQNEYLPSGSGEVNAILTVTAGEGASTTANRTFGIICDTSGSMEGPKIDAAKDAMTKLVGMLPPSCSFFIVTGCHQASVVFPVATATPENKHSAVAAIAGIAAKGATKMSTWLQAALQEFKTTPEGVRQALLLTDGQNDTADAKSLKAALDSCAGVFQCDCRGVGTDWRVDQLRQIADKLLGTTDIIPVPQQIGPDFKAILEKALGKNISDLQLRLWTVPGAEVKFCKEVSPEIVDLSQRFRQREQNVREYATGAWGGGESRDFHFCIKVKPGSPGESLVVGQVTLVHFQGGAESKLAEARIRAVWTGDAAMSTKINPMVAHYTGQVELAQSIQAGLEARSRGDDAMATTLLSKAVRIAALSGNEATCDLLKAVVDVQDAEKGTIVLKRAVPKEDEMALETRSLKTSRIPKYRD